MNDPRDPRHPEGTPDPGMPPELMHADDAPDRRVERARRRRAIWVTATAVLLAVALLFYGLLPLIRSSNEMPAEPGPLPAEPAGSVDAFGQQQPVWERCGDSLECADVYVPLDWDEPAGERITLRLAKHPASDGEPLGTLFVNPGGPGASGVSYLSGNIDGAVSEDLQQDYDVVAWDPRGVGHSTPVHCLPAAEMDEYLFDGSETEGLEIGSDEWIDASVAASAEFGEACAAETGELLGHVDTMSTVRDLDMLRTISGDETLNYLGYSYGTYIGARYADAFPERVGRLVLDGAIDPDATMFDVVREQTRGFEAALRTYASDCLSRDDCPLSGDVDAAMRQIGGVLERVESDPIEASDGRVLYPGTMLTAIITPLYSPESWPALDQLFASVTAGEADTAFRLADFYYEREGGQYPVNKTEAFAAINCLDYANDLDPNRMQAEAAELEVVAPTIGRFQGYGDVGCAEWPFPGAEERGPVQAEGADPILVVGTTGDPATPYRWAESLTEQLESGVLVTFHGEGHTAYGKNACVNATVDEYLLQGRVPSADPQCE